jgi:CheY-like chemotaxis protein
MPKVAALLLVDDEALILEMVEEALLEAGFEVTCARDADEALRLFRAPAAEFCAIVTDVNLGPGLTGWDIARLLRRDVADIPVIYTTGGSAHEYPANAVSGSLLVSKPCASRMIVQAVASLVASRV